ncbi:MAG: 1-acyl-sn-glycerol-3-phosphate acyltransferase [Verrucomicrobiaceae bacterium]|nr:1-acyl-sn-glycerol-3-phosphate acyltransferase [Verrucomicrobiaceae bacterium]
MNLPYWAGHRFFRELSRGFFGLQAHGLENVQFHGPALLACNHVSYLDPPFVGATLDEDIIFFARKTLFRFKFSNWLLTRWQTIPVDKDKPDPGSLKTVFRRLKEGKKVLIFPEGTRSPDGTLQTSEPGVGMLIAKAEVPVVPVRIFGSFEALSRKHKLPQPASIRVVFGKPWVCDPSLYQGTGKAAYQQIADEVMARIAELQPKD